MLFRSVSAETVQKFFDTADVFGAAFGLKAIPVSFLVDEVGIIRQMPDLNSLADTQFIK